MHQGRKSGLNTKYNREKWGLIARNVREQDESGGGWEITKGKYGGRGILAKIT